MKRLSTLFRATLALAALCLPCQLHAGTGGPNRPFQVAAEGAEVRERAAVDARRRLQIVEKRGQSSDHPVLLGVPESHYLKCVIARVIE